jgi:hypothetical protein
MIAEQEKSSAISCLPSRECSKPKASASQSDWTFAAHLLHV